MEHTLFTVWMLLYFPLNELAHYFGYLAWGKKNREYSDNVRGSAALVHVIIYLYVAYLLY